MSDTRTYRALKGTLETTADVAIDLGIGALSRTYVGSTYGDVVSDLTRLAEQSGITGDGIMRITVEPRTIRVPADDQQHGPASSTRTRLVG